MCEHDSADAMADLACHARSSRSCDGACVLVLVPRTSETTDAVRLKSDTTYEATEFVRHRANRRTIWRRQRVITAATRLASLRSCCQFVLPARSARGSRYGL